jgi:DNA-directed RNA polymerase specialized sigma24 family protein
MAVGPAGDSSSFPSEIGRALRQALIAACGPEAGAAATVDAVTWAATHREQLRSMQNPTAHLYRIGRRRARWNRRRLRQLPEVPEAAAPWIEAAVPQILLDLPQQQRVAVLLQRGFGWSEAEVAGVLGLDDDTVRGAVADGLSRLRSGLSLGEEAPDSALHNQIAAYAEVLDQAVPQLEDLIAEKVGSSRPRIQWQAGPVLTTAAVALLVVGVLLVLRSNGSSTADDPAASSTTAGSVLPVVDVQIVNRSAVTPEMFSNWEHQFAGPGAVTVVDGSYHMLSAAYGDDVATVAYAISDDGAVWAQAAAGPVLDLSEAPWAPLEIDRAAPRSVIVDREGAWQLFFDIVWFDKGADQLRASIGRAVAADPAGTWTYDPAPVISRNAESSWMASRVSSPSVVARDGRLVMTFVGESSAGGVVGVAESPQGAVWTVRPEPVYAASGEWEGASISQVDLVAVPDGMAMFFSGESSDRRGLAVSADGVEWTPHPDNPLLAAADASAFSLFDTEFVSDGANVLAYVETGRARGRREVAVLRLTLDLAEVIELLLGA